MTKMEKPIYYQIYTLLKKKIELNEYTSGALLPSEKELIEEFKASRITIRRALTDLEQDGYVKKRKGIGTIVLNRKPSRDIIKLSGFTEETRSRGQIPSSVIVELSIIEANIKIGEMLSIEPGEKVYFLKRLRLADGKIMGLHETYISMRFNLDIKEEDFKENSSLYDYYERNNIKLSSADETMEILIPNNNIRLELFMKENEPVFYRERVTFNDKKEAIEFSKNYYKYSSYKFSIHLERK